ncbi:MurR/RpiR family transcriptional regulator [Bacillus paralicheniformis]|uniref:MurR/RpiR family transcriptional regulator n=1 Tax=Bacillus paralicheniformis TaxID=1648923 RepID=UPI0030DA7509
MFSYSGSTKDTIEVAKKAKEKGARIISITRFVKSPLTTHSDVTLLCGANEGPLQGGSLSAKIAQLYLLDVLYVEYFKRTYQESIDNKESTARNMNLFHHYSANLYLDKMMPTPFPNSLSLVSLKFNII